MLETKRHLIKQDLTILEALGRLNELSGTTMTLIVTDGNGIMTGTLTDGDIRRSILSGHLLNDPVSQVMHRDFSALRPGHADAGTFKEMRKKGIRLVPMLDNDGSVIRLYDLDKTRAILPLSAMIMAGGRGERLRPMTDDTPKPLLQIGGKAIIDYNVEALAESGIEDITVSVRYLADKIISHFDRPVSGVNVRCIVEDKPLGTIGALSLVNDFTHDDILVMNSDLLTTITFEDMYVRHRDEQADITIGAIPYTVSVPYAILATEGHHVTSLQEKPTYSYYANAGIYIFSRKAANMIEPGERIDATDLIARAIKEQMNVVYFPINGTWIDVGSQADFRHAQEIMKYHHSTNR